MERRRHLRAVRSERQRRRRLAGALAAVAVVVFAVPVLLAANTVASSRAHESDHAVTANQLKPPACDGLSLSAVLVNTNGGNPSELVLGTAANDNLSGGRGNDCMVMGDGDDLANGMQGTDVCLGQGGNDIHAACETTDGP